MTERNLCIGRMREKAIGRGDWREKEREIEKERGQLFNNSTILNLILRMEKK